MSTLVFDSLVPKQAGASFRVKFWEMADLSDEIVISVGYVDVAALTELFTYISQNEGIQLRLIIGMQYFEGFSKPQLEVLTNFSGFLKETGRGEIRVATRVKNHGKLYIFNSNGQPESCYIGSSNLSGITRSGTPSLEFGVVGESDLASQIAKVFEKEVWPTGQEFSTLSIEPKINPVSPLDEIDEVSRVEESLLLQLKEKEPNLSFDLEIKPTEKSNLNVYFGKGRESSLTGRTLPRPWYEAEIIVSKKVTSLPGYPAPGADFDVITDDGHSFQARVSGDNGKNFRSSKELSILGAFLKGRLESYGILTPGEMVTAEHLDRYGRNSVTLSYFDEFDCWFMDFSV